ncbi:hypothetical protein DM01DRAFT_1198097 [Hesseltinella vesiculosa]|uniref:RRM domain-containing protein n=1 Tax=Hesseltinella vesiculosa TaxID=101127 RepID=A0A1X2G379_9FUNG|nr:hypothetical protein DM01DRAFT_1198097 [Hesseltinella vesiculosa]
MSETAPRPGELHENNTSLSTTWDMVDRSSEESADHYSKYEHSYSPRSRSYSRQRSYSRSPSRSRSRSRSPYYDRYRYRSYSHRPPPNYFGYHSSSYRSRCNRYHDTYLPSRYQRSSRSPPPRRSSPSPRSQPPPSFHSNPDCRLYVGNLSYEVAWLDLKDFMERGLFKCKMIWLDGYFR